jgi:hypothetical protein
MSESSKNSKIPTFNFENAVRFDKESKRGSVLDVIKVMTKIKGGNLNRKLNEIYEKHPEFKTFFTKMKINGFGKPTPTGKFTHLIELVFVLECRNGNASKFRRKFADYLCRIMSGDESLIPMILESRQNLSPELRSTFMNGVVTAEKNKQIQKRSRQSQNEETVSLQMKKLCIEEQQEIQKTQESSKNCHLAIVESTQQRLDTYIKWKNTLKYDGNLNDEEKKFILDQIKSSVLSPLQISLQEANIYKFKLNLRQQNVKVLREEMEIEIDRKNKELDLKIREEMEIEIEKKNKEMQIEIDRKNKELDLKIREDEHLFKKEEEKRQARLTEIEVKQKELEFKEKYLKNQPVEINHPVKDNKKLQQKKQKEDWKSFFILKKK